VTQKFWAESVGTFALVFCGTGAVVIDQVSGGTVTHTGVALTFGLIVTAMIYTFGSVSGAHLNPAVTLAFWSTGQFAGRQVAPYLVAQCTGALAASAALRYLFPTATTLGQTLPAGSDGQSFVLELVLTFLLMLVVVRVALGAPEVRPLAGLVIGGVVLLEAQFAGPICGASMNPARSLGPALVSGQLGHLWIYLTAPVAGAVLAAWMGQTIFSKTHSNDDSTA
jgi:aquaporin Z